MRDAVRAGFFSIIKLHLPYYNMKSTSTLLKGIATKAIFFLHVALGILISIFGRRKGSREEPVPRRAIPARSLPITLVAVHTRYWGTILPERWYVYARKTTSADDEEGGPQQRGLPLYLGERCLYSPPNRLSRRKGSGIAAALVFAAFLSGSLEVSGQAAQINLSPAQRRATERYWIFNRTTRMDFGVSGSATATISSFGGQNNSLGEGFSTATDVDGNLVFYTSATQAYNRNGQATANGAITGNNSATRAPSFYPI